MTIIMSQEIGEVASSEIKTKDMVMMMNMIAIQEILIREGDLAV